MKNLFFFLSLFACLQGITQGTSPIQRINQNVVYSINGATAGLSIPRDTTIRASDSNYVWIASKKVGDSAFIYVFDKTIANRWRRVSGGIGGGSGGGTELFGTGFVRMNGGNPEYIATLPDNVISSAGTWNAKQNALNNGFGVQSLAGNTVAVDTAAMATRGRVQKGIDSLGVVKLNVSDTTVFFRKSGHAGNRVPFTTSGGTVTQSAALQFNGSTLSVGQGDFSATDGISIGSGKAAVTAHGTGMRFYVNGGNPFDPSKKFYWINTQKQLAEMGSFEPTANNKHYFRLESGVDFRVDTLKGTGTRIATVLPDGTIKPGKNVDSLGGGLSESTADSRYIRKDSTVELETVEINPNNYVTRLYVSGNDLRQQKGGTDSLITTLNTGGGTSPNAVLNNQSNTFQSGHKQSFDGETDFLAGSGRAVYFRGGYLNFADADFVNPGTGIYSRTSWNKRFQSLVGDASGGVSVRAHGSLGLEAGVDSTGAARGMTIERGGLINFNSYSGANGPSTTGGWGATQVLTLTNDGYLVKKPLSDFGTGSAVLYSDLGQNTDGALTQKAATDAINGRAPLAHNHNASDVNAGVFSPARIASGTATEGYVPKIVGGLLTFSPDATGGAGGGGDVYLANENNFTNHNTFRKRNYHYEPIDMVTPGEGIIFRDGSNNSYNALVGDAAGGTTLGSRGNFGIEAGLGTADAKRVMTLESSGLVQFNHMANDLGASSAGGWGYNNYTALTSGGYLIKIPRDSVLTGVRLNGTTYYGSGGRGVVDLGTISGGGGGTLQTVTDAGATTTNKITAAGFNSGNTASQSSINPGFELYNSGGNYYGLNLNYFGTKYATTALMPAGGNFVVATTSGDGTQAGLQQKLIVDGSTGGLTVMGGEVTFGTVAKIKEYTNYLALLTPNQSAAIPLKVGGLTVSDSYADNAPTNGVFSKGDVLTNGNVGWRDSRGVLSQVVDANAVDNYAAVGLGNSVNLLKGYMRTAPITANRFYQFPDKDGTVAMLSDITGGGANAVLNNQNNTYTAGSKQTFQSGPETAGMRFGGVTVNPTALSGGDLWYRSDENKFRYYDGTQVREFVTAALAQTLTNKTISGADNTITNLNASNLTSGAVPRAQLSNMRVLRGIKFVSPTASENQFIFRTAGAIVVEAVDVVLSGTTPSVTYAVHYGTTYGTSQGTIVASNTATTTGTPAINTASIPAGAYVWLTTSATSGTVTDFSVQISYRLN